MSISVLQFDEIKCNSFRGCGAFFQATPVGCCYSAETRRQARAEGWVTGVKQQRYRWGRHLPQQDFCPKHANEAAR